MYNHIAILNITMLLGGDPFSIITSLLWGIGSIVVVIFVMAIWEFFCEKELINIQHEHEICDCFINEVLANTTKVRSTTSIRLFALEEERQIDNENVYRPYWIGSFMGANYITRYFCYNAITGQLEEITKVDFYQIAMCDDVDIEEPDYTENC